MAPHPTRVLLDLSVLATDTTTRGIGRYLTDLARGLAHEVAGHGDVELLAVESMERGRPPVVSRDVEAVVDELRSRKERKPHRAWAFETRFGLVRAAREARADVVHSGHPNATPLGRLPCPRVVTCHDLIPLEFPEQYCDINDGFARGRLLLDRRRFGRASHVISISEHTRRVLMDRLGIPAERITVVHNGLVTDRFPPTPAPDDADVVARLGLTSPFLLCVGAADHRKNAENTFAGVSRAGSSGLQRPLVAWAARLGEAERDRILRAAREAGIADRLHLLGFVDDAALAALYRTAAALLFVSRAEGFGYPAVEAMAAGCPVITSNQSSLPEVTGNAAQCVDPESPDAIARAIKTLLTPGAREHWSHLGVTRAAQFSVKRMATATLDVLLTAARREESNLR